MLPLFEGRSPYGIGSHYRLGIFCYCDQEPQGRIRDLDHGFFQITAVYGFMQTPNVQELMLACTEIDPALSSNDTSFLLGRDNGKMARWRKDLFIFRARNARPANAFVQIPPNRTVVRCTVSWYDIGVPTQSAYLTLDEPR